MVHYKLARGRCFYARIHTVLSLSLSPYCSFSNLFFLIFFFGVGGGRGAFIWKFSSFIYSHTSCIPTLYMQSSRSSLGYLFHQIPVKGGRRNCLAMNLLFRGHFLINATNKATNNHLMRMQQVRFHRKLLSTTSNLSLNAIILSTQIFKRYFVSSPPLHERTPSSSLKCFHSRNERWSLWFYPSSVLEPLQYIYKRYLEENGRIF